MTLHDSSLRLIQVLEAENEALASGDAARAVQFKTEKQDAVASLQAALPGAIPDAALTGKLRELVARNGVLLRQAIEIQGRVLVMVARAALLATPGSVRYCAHGAAASEAGAVALTLRA